MRVGERLLSHPDRVAYAIIAIILLLALFGTEAR